LTALLRGLFCESFTREEEEERKGYFSGVDSSLVESLRALVPRSGVVLLESLRAPRDKVTEVLEAGEDTESERSARLEASLLNSLRQFWRLDIEVVVVADDGGVEDAAVLAATAALVDTVLPIPAAESGVCQEATSTQPQQPQKLKLRALPMATTFALLNNPSRSEGSPAPAELLLIGDPSISNGEDQAPHLLPMATESGRGVGLALSLVGLGAKGLSGSHFTVVHDGRRAEDGETRLLFIRKLGGTPLPLDMLHQALRISAERAVAVSSELSKSV